MNIDDLKSGWQVLNNRLAETEKLNKRIIKEMIRKRTVSAYKRIFYYDLFGTFLIISILTYFSFQLLRQNPIYSIYTSCAFISLMVVGLLIQGVSFYYLNHFNTESNKLVESSKWIMKYHLLNKRCNVYVPLIVIIVIVVCFSFEFQRSLFSLTEIIVRCVLGFLIGSIICWASVRYYNNNFREIQKGFKELEELEENNKENDQTD